MTRLYDLAVVGGGPAGSSAAITARVAGLNVLLLERGFFPRQKVCGEFVSAESLDLLETLLCNEHISLLADAIRIPRTRLFLDGHIIATELDPPAASIARWDLDAALWASAGQSGVETRQRTTVQDIAGRGPFHISTSSGDFESRAVINASGRWSNLTPASSRDGASKKKWLGLKGHFSEEGAEPTVDLYFFERGYCGLLPVHLHRSGPSASRINVCAMVSAEVASTMQEVFALHPGLKERSLRWLPLGETASTSPLFFGDPQPVREGILMAGDAAVFVDPFIGDGISMALRSGSLAAKCLVPFFSNEISLEDAGALYKKKYQQKLLRVFKASSRIRRLLDLPRAIRRPIVYFVHVTPGIPKYLVKHTR